MGNKKRNVSLPSHNTYICIIVVVLVYKRSETSRYSQWATRSEMFRFHSHNTHICTIYVSKRSETSRFHIDNGQQEAKCFASIPTTHICYIVSVKVQFFCLPNADWSKPCHVPVHKTFGNWSPIKHLLTGQ